MRSGSGRSCFNTRLEAYFLLIGGHGMDRDYLGLGGIHALFYSLAIAFLNYILKDVQSVPPAAKHLRIHQQALLLEAEFVELH